MADWVTISSLGTAGGTLVLAGATFSAVRSANRSARIAEQGLQEQRRPFSVDLLYSDQAGGHRTISRFVATPAGDDRWISYVGLHWNLDPAGRDDWGRR